MGLVSMLQGPVLLGAPNCWATLKVFHRLQLLDYM